MQEQREFIKVPVCRGRTPAQNGDNPEKSPEAPLSAARRILGVIRSSQTEFVKQATVTLVYI